MTLRRYILEENPFELMFKDFFNSDLVFGPIGSNKVPYPVDIKETEKGLQIDIAAIGLAADDIEITVESDVLRVKYQKESQADSDSDKYIHRGIARRSFNLGWKIGAQFSLKDLSAEMSNGLLTIVIPYSEESAPRKVKIKSK